MACSSGGSGLGRRSDGKVMQTDSGLRSVQDVVSGFDSRKRQLVRSIGFDGLLHMPALKPGHRRFSVWLLSKVDTESRSIVVDEGKRISFTREDVGLVFGIPCSGQPVVGKKIARVGVRDRILKGVLRLDSKDHGSLKAAQDVLDRVHGGVMTKEEEDCFKIAFVVFVMSSLLAPGPRVDYATGDYWNALADPDEISHFDWASFVIERLLAAVAKLKADIAANRRLHKLAGCPLFLQVLYLDSVDLGSWNSEHSVLPRIRAFSGGRIASMVAADRTINPDFRSNQGFGASKLRPLDEVCYSWAKSAHQQGCSWIPEPFEDLIRGAFEEIHRSCPGGNQALEAVVKNLCTKISCSIVYVCGQRLISGETEPGSQGPARRGGAEAHTPRLEHQPAGGATRKRKAGAGDVSMSAGTSARFGASRGTIAKSSGRRGGTCTADDQLGTEEGSVSTLSGDGFVGHESLVGPWSPDDEYAGADVLLDDEDLDLCTDAEFSSQMRLSQRETKAYRFIDLNIQSSGNPLVDSGIVAPGAQIRCLVKSPWELGAVLDIGSSDPAAFLDDLKCPDITDHAETPWFVHYIPKYLEVVASSARVQFLGLAELESDLMDVLLRSFKQSDDELYREYPRVRWRHFVESDFMAILTAGWQRRYEANIWAQFVGSHLGYDVRWCKMLFFPALLNNRWVCYAWNICENVIVIFDPSRSELEPETVSRMHRRIVSRLRAAMGVVASKYFVGWQHEWGAADVQVVRPTGYHLMSGFYEISGILVAYFCRNFDGGCLSPMISDGNFDVVAGVLLRDAVELYGNYGKLPSRWISPARHAGAWHPKDGITGAGH